jgi:hypothetical protein
MILPTMKTHAKLAALGALGVSAGALLLFFLFVWIARRTSTGGLDVEHSMITVVSTAVIFAALIGAHLAFARQLFAYAREQNRR